MLSLQCAPNYIRTIRVKKLISNELPLSLSLTEISIMDESNISTLVCLLN